MQKQSDEGIILYNYFRSSASFRVRIALNLKNLKYKYEAVNLLKDDQKSEQFIQKNPQKLGEIIFIQVPALYIDGETLFESLPIIQYLDETRPNVELQLFGKNAFQKSQILSLCEMVGIFLKKVNAGIQPLINLRTLNKLSELNPSFDKNQWIQHWINEGFQAIENYLQKHSGKYCFGDNITAADIVLFPQFFLAKNRFNVNLFQGKVDISKYEKIQDVFERLSQQKEFIDAFPQNQPDFVQ